jgi:glycosyltransferase involved in cell wall biosynthesis
MKICFFVDSTDNFNPNAGGVQRITRVLVKEFQKIGIESIFLSMPNPTTNIIYKFNEFCFPNSKLNHPENILFIKKLNEREKIQIFINQYGLELNSIGFLKKIKNDVKIISAHHNCISCLYDKYREIFKQSRGATLTRIVDHLGLWSLVRYLFRLRQKYIWSKMLTISDAVVLYFNSFENELLELTGIKSNKIHIIPNPSPYVYKLRTHNTVNKRIVYVGRVIELQKRVDVLMELWKKLHQEFENWTFDLVGEGDYMETAKQFAKTNNLDRIVFHGIQDPLPFWDSSDIFTLTSDFEGFGMVLIEAQARGTVPITFNCFSAISEVVDNNVSGIILKENTVNEAYVVIKNLIENEQEILRMRQNGFAQTEKFDITSIANRWSNLFKKIKKQ